MKWEVTSTTNEMNGDVPVDHQAAGRATSTIPRTPQITVDIQLTLTTPANAKGPVPVIMEFGGVGLRTGRGSADRQGPPGQAPAGPTWQQQVLAKGWGYASIYPNSIQADNGAGLTQGIIGLVNKGQPASPTIGARCAPGPGAQAARSIISRPTRPSTPSRSASRATRATARRRIVAMAYDQRFAIAYVSSSGEGGAKLHRRNWGELVENVAATGEYHWMAGNFLKYAGPLNWNDLPVDSHELVALCAPRPVFLSAGATERRRLGGRQGHVPGRPSARARSTGCSARRDLGTTEFPPIETALIDGDVAFRQHSGGHTPGPNWPTFLEFASRYLKVRS